MGNEVEMEGSWDSASSESSDEEVAPRIGPEYQVDALPHCTHNFFTENSVMDEDEEAFAAGLPVQITSIRVNNEQKQATPEQQNCCDERAEGEGAECGGEDGESSRTDSRKRKGKKKRKGNWLTVRRLRAKNTCEQMDVIVPGDSFHPWEECEEAAFVLGLYLFGKDFNALNRFLETRRLTDLQHYYYSTFFGTAAYKRWVAARNNCSKRIVIGRHILVGWRQEELLRRLLPELEECSRPVLFDAMAGFNKGDVSFEKYVSRIKAVTGLELLIDSVGLGCGKRDLTMGSVDPFQSGKKFELPPGKAFSDYTASEMFRTISGGCRLSKTRAQDLFWEGVWPRLLAKGWSSEQSGKGPLVYMIPGIKRYSKRALMKGRDYFDSISEVLNHLASDSSLLELPELDNELLNNRVSKPQAESSNGASRSGDRKRRPTLWLSKGTSHASFKEKEDDPEDEKDAKKKKQQQEERTDVAAADASEDRKSDAAAHGSSGVSSSVRISEHRQAELQPVTTSPAGVRSCEETRVDSSSFKVEGSTLENSSTWEGGGQIIPRKRSFYDSFSETSASVAGVTAMRIISTAEPRKVLLLNSMIKHYLGNGKSMRLYGPTNNLLQAKTAYKVFIRGFQQALCRNRKGIVNLNLNLLVAVHHSGKNNRPQLDNGDTQVLVSLPKKQLELLEDEPEAQLGPSSSSEKVSCRDCGATEDEHQCCRRLVD